MNRSTRNRRNQNSVRAPRNKLLATAIVAALAMGAAGTAAAVSLVNYSLDTTISPWVQNLTIDNYLHSITNAQDLGANVSAPISNSHLFYDGVGTGSPSTVNNNSIAASATGNAALPNANSSSLYGNTIDLGLLGSSGANSGLAILSGQLNNGNVVKASVAGSDITTVLTNHASGDVSNSNDTISANSQVNVASSTIGGNLPSNGFIGSAAGQATSTFVHPAGPLVTHTSSADGDLVVGNVQNNANNHSSATVTDGEISSVDTANGAVTGNFTTNGNTIAASFGGNASSNVIAANGGATSYQGSAVVSNSQVNDTATGSASGIGGYVDNDLAGTGSFDGALTISDNRITANTQGNQANNAIAFADGIDLSGNGGSGVDLTYGYISHQSEGTANGDLVLLNQQANNASRFSSSLLSGAAYFDGVITSDYHSLDAGASVTVDGNAIQSGASGNVSSNRVSANGGSTFADAVSVGNAQSNTVTPILASVDFLLVAARVFASSQGALTVSDNTIGANATGSSAVTQINLAGTSFQSGTGGVSLSVGVNPAIQSDAVNTGGAGISVANLQNNKPGSDVTASVGDAVVQALPAFMTGGAAIIGNNAIGASAVGNDAFTGAQLAGANASTTAVLGSYQDNESNVRATVGAGLTYMSAFTVTAANAALVASDNSFSASAYANRGSNALGTSFTNTTLGGGGWSTSSSAIGGNTFPWPYSNQGHAALGLLSNQYAAGAVSATVGGNGIFAGVRDAASDSSLTVQGNTSSAAAVANSVSNTLSPGVGNLTTASGNAEQIGTLGSVQNARNSVVGASVSPYNRSIYASAGTVSDPASLTRSAMSVSDNHVSAFAGGNLANNGMAVTGTDFAPTAVPGVVNGQSSDDGTNSLTSAAYTLQSVQNSDGGSRSATADNASIEAVVYGDVNASPLTVSGNSVGTEARDNRATNALSLTGFSTLDTTAALQSVQTSEATLTSTVTHTSIGIGAGIYGAGFNVSDSALTVSGNQLSAWAIANTASNGLNVQSGQLSGDSNGAYAGIPDLRGAVVGNGFDALVNADYGLSNVQTRSGTVAASISGTGLIGAGIYGSLSGGSLTSTGNDVTALAQSNSANNEVALGGTSITASAALLNSQSVAANSNVSATISQTNGGTFPIVVGILGGTLSGAPVTVVGNTAIAQAGLNDATNAVSATGSSSINTTGVSGSGASTDSTTYAGYQGAVADYALYNTQSALSSASASIAPGLNGVLVGGAISNGALTVSDNSLGARASANSAGNSVSLTGAANIGATAAIANVQTASGGTVKASNTGAQVGISNNNGDISNAPLTVSGNTLSSNASGNSAGNSLQNLPVALNADSSESTQGSVTPLNGSTALANNSLLNSQDNSDAISATISNATVGININVSPVAALQSSVATVGNNVASAIASGNSAGNSIELSNLPTGVSSSALVSNQINSAAISATVTSTQIGVNAGATSTSPVTVTGNVISATAVGNSVSNSISVGH